MTNNRNDIERADGDPRLTAYALGELEGAERAEVELLLQRDAAARAEVEAIRATAAELGEAFAAEAAGPAPSLTPAQHAVIRSAARSAPRSAPAASTRLAALRWLAPLAAAAMLVVWVTLELREESRNPAALSSASAPVAKSGAPAEAGEVSRLRSMGYVGAGDLPGGQGGGEGGSRLDGHEKLAWAGAPRDQAAASAPVTGEREAGRTSNGKSQLDATKATGMDVGAAASKQPYLTQEQVDMLRGLGYVGPNGGGGGGSSAPAAPPSQDMARLQALGYSGGGNAGAAVPPGPVVQHNDAMAGRGKAAGPPAAAPASTTTFSSELETADEEVVAMESARDDREAPHYRYLKAPPGSPGTESYQPIVEQDFQSPWTVPLSTFGVDVDTASYSNVRRFLNNGQLPPADAVRLEELVNYFRYEDAGPAADAPEGCPFGVTVQTAPAPWAPQHRLVRIGLKGREVAPAARPSSNIVFLLDVSGSMNEPDKLPLLKQCLALLTRQLDARDRVAMVVYAGAAGLVLDSTVCDAAGREKVLEALDRLAAGGSTAGAAGIQLAYDTAAKTFLKDGTNRVVLCTDGDFNVGITDRDSLQGLIESRARGGVFLTVLGYGEGNLKDGTAELLADKGNGLYAYIDSLDEGRRVLVQQMGGSLITIAKDVKLQVEFNPAQVGSYRLLGYENRALAAQDFNDDRKDAGDIGAGHGVTALYEIVPPGLERAGVDALRYQERASAPQPELKPSDEMLTVKLRWKAPDGDTSRKIELPVRDAGGTLQQAPADLRFAAAVAGFGMKLRGSDKARELSWQMIVALAESARGTDPDGWRAEFVRLAKMAAGMQGETVGAPLSPEQQELLRSLGYTGHK